MNGNEMNGEERRERQIAWGISIAVAATVAGAAVILGALTHHQGHHPAATGAAVMGTMGIGAAGIAWMNHRIRTARAAFITGVVLAAAAMAITRLA